MNKKTKLLLVLLSSTALTAGAFGLAACAGEAHNEEYYAQYQQYVAEADGDVLSYEDWLISILEDAKGEKGDKGDAGEPGKDGTKWYTGAVAPSDTQGVDGDFYLNTATFEVYTKATGTWGKPIGIIKGTDGTNGTNGVGIDGVTYKDGKLEIVLSDGSKIEVALPEEITHVHSYDEEIITVVAPTHENDGIGYKKCTDADCEHIELVAIPKLRYTLTITKDGMPLEGVSVQLVGQGVSETGSTEAVVSGKDGVVLIDVDKLGEYKIKVEGYLAYTVNTSVVNNEATVEVVPAIKDNTISAEGVYGIEITSSSFNSQIFGPAITFTGNGEKVAYKITVIDEIGAIKNGSNYESSIVKVATESKDAQASFYVYEDLLGKDFEYGDSLVYAIRVEKTDVPEDGTVEELALDGAALTTEGITKTAEANQWIYYTWTTTNTKVTKLKFTLGADNVLEFNAYDSATFKYVTRTPDQDGVLTYSDSQWMTNFTFRVKSASGNISVSAEYYSAPGEKNNPAKMENYKFGTALSGKAQKAYGITYYEWVADRTGEIVIEGAEVTDDNGATGLTQISIYKDISVTMPSSEYDAVNHIDFYNVIEGKTYYFGVQTTGGALSYEFQLRTYNASTDDGYGAAHPLEITGDDYKLENFYGNKYLVFKNTEDFEVWTQFSDEEYEFTAYYYSGVTTLEENKEGAIYFTKNISYSNNYKTGLKSGESVYIQISAYESDPLTTTLSNYVNKNEEVTDKFLVKDSNGELVSGVKVIIYYKDAAEVEHEIASGLTNDEGVAEITYMSGKYLVKVEGAKKVSGISETDYHKGTEENDIVVAGKSDYSLTVLGTDGETPVKDVTVTVYDPDNEVVATGTTGEEGIYSFKAFDDNYTVVLSGLPENTLAETIKLSGDNREGQVVLVAVTPVTAGTSEAPTAATVGYSSFSVGATEGWFSYTATGSGTVTIDLDAATIKNMTIGDIEIVKDGVWVETFGDYSEIIEAGSDAELNTINISAIRLTVGKGNVVKYSVVGEEGAKAIADISIKTYPEFTVDVPVEISLGYSAQATYMFATEAGHTYKVTIAGDDEQSITIFDDEYSYIAGYSDMDDTYSAEGTFEGGATYTFIVSAFYEVNCTITITDITEAA